MDAKELIPFFDCDFLALEGFSEEPLIPKIICAKNMEDMKEKLDDSVFAISGKISTKINEFNGIKAINGLTNIKELVDLIEKKAVNDKILLNS